LCARYGAEQAERVAWAGQAVPVTVLQRNALRATPAEFAQDVHVAYGGSVEVAGDAAFVPATVAVTDAAPFLEGRVFVQDATAHAAAAALRARPGERVLDLCAAPGGKSVALALAMNDQGLVVACDTVPERLKRVSENVARLGLSCVRTQVTTPAGVEPPAEGEPFDAALVDVPCANTGVIARRPEARLGLTPQKLDSLVKVQQVLLRKAAHAVRAGGRVVYSTCSLEPPENEQVVAAFLAANPTWHLDAAETTLPAWGPRPADWRDGGYFARLLRKE
jgi:16S rRNA (cytosine967-C5)-methyltransferase